jgi:hypothetical protein
MQNSYITVGPNGKTNGTNFFSLCSMQLGKDYKNWQSLPEFYRVIKQAHEVLKLEGSVRALELHVNFLTRNHIQSTETKLKRASAYNGALLEAYEAGLVDIETVKKLLV